MMRHMVNVRSLIWAKFVSVFCAFALLFFASSKEVMAEGAEVARALLPPGPTARLTALPNTRWAHLQGTEIWTRSALSALKAHGAPLVSMVPGDIKDWCPAYPAASDQGRRAFWVGFLSALAKHESTYRPQVVGGGGRWYGLLQILPATARGYGCRARKGTALKHGPSNLSCGIRIMTKTVLRDGVVSRRGRGVAADWGPLVSRKKRQDMQAWTRKQTYCTPLSSVRPKLRPPQTEQTIAKKRPKLRPVLNESAEDQI